MDVLSQVLQTVRMTGAIFFRVECVSPWGFHVPEMREAGSILAPDRERVVSYHLVTDGRAIVRFENGDEIRVGAGDIVVLPQGPAHTVSHGSPPSFADSSAELSRAFSSTPRTIHLGRGSGTRTTIVCGYFACDRQADRLFLAGLPRAFKVNLRTGSPGSGESGSWLESSIRHLVREAQSMEPGAGVLLSKMAEALFVEALRRHMEVLPPLETGWLAGARDPVTGGALALMHAEPLRRWNLHELARETGVSRSVMVERFSRFLGESPLSYLTRWRLLIATRRLRNSNSTVLEIAMDVGYRSESAFIRAFKRQFGVPPAAYRRTHHDP